VSRVIREGLWWTAAFFNFREPA